MEEAEGGNNSNDNASEVERLQGIIVGLTDRVAGQAETLALMAERSESARRKGRVDACRVINEMAARFPSSAEVLRDCVRRIERMEES